MRDDPFYRSTRWLKLRQKALRRDGYMCQISKRYGKHVPANLVHHIFPRSQYPEYEWELWNLISVSASAHNKLHIRDDDELTEEGKRLMERTKLVMGNKISTIPPTAL